MESMDSYQVPLYLPEVREYVREFRKGKSNLRIPVPLSGRNSSPVSRSKTGFLDAVWKRQREGGCTLFAHECGDADGEAATRGGG